MSRPLRAAAAVLGGWIAIRAAMLTGGGSAAMVNAAAEPPHPPVPARTAALDPVPPPEPDAEAFRPPSALRPLPPPRSSRRPPAPPAVPDAASARPVTANTSAAVVAAPVPDPVPTLPTRAAPAAHDRFQLSGWALVRGAASPGGLAPAGTLGGSQIGMRGWFAPGPAGLVLTARVSSPLGSRNGSEASVGLGFRKGGVGIIVEERISLDASGGARPSVTAFGGFSEVRVRGKLRADGYAQAGVVGLNNRTGFADGAVRVGHPIAEKPVRLAVGAGAWGGAQPGLARLDIGPQIVARVPVMGGTLRIAGEWRFRVAGNADPGSGPVLGIGADF